MNGRPGQNWEIFLFNTATQEYTNLTQTSHDERDSAWSPDGRKIAYSARSGKGWNLYFYDLETGQHTQITDDLAYDGAPAWSPDGTQILFESSRNGNLDIFLFDFIHQTITEQTSSSYADIEPVWHPDGTSFLFTSWRNGERQLFQQEINGVDVRSISEPGEEPCQVSFLYSSASIIYRSDSLKEQKIIIRNLEQPNLTILPNPYSQNWPFLVKRNQNDQLVALRTISGITGIYPTGWQLFLTSIDIDTHYKESLLKLSGEWSQPSCRSTLPTQGLSWERVARLNTQTYIAHLDVDQSHYLRRLVNIDARQPVLSSSVVPSFERLRQHIMLESGYDFLGTLNDVWRGLDHPDKVLISWHRAGRAFDTRDWFATDRQRLFIAREWLDGQIYFRLYILAQNQDGTKGRPLKESLWFTEGRLVNAELREHGGRFQVPSNGYFVDITELASREGWTRIPALTPPYGNWKHRYIDMEFWHYEKRSSLTWYAAMKQVYQAEELNRRYNPQLLLSRSYTWAQLVTAGIVEPEKDASCRYTRRSYDARCAW